MNSADRPRPRARTYAILVAILVGGAAAGGAFVLLSSPLGPPPSNAPVPSFDVVRTLMHVDLNASATTDPNGDIESYEWDFEDDSAFDASGVATSFDYPQEGQYAIRLRVTDAQGHVSEATRLTSVATSTLDLVFSDFFAVSFGEWWDHRRAVYAEAPVGAECFSQAGISNGVCTPTDPAVPDLPGFPYTHWWDLPDGRGWSNPDNVAIINAPYRLHAIGTNTPAYTLEWPVFLPVLNESALPGSRLDFDWRMDFLDTATASALGDAGCSISPRALDGYHIRSEIELTLDLQQARRTFGVEAADPVEAQAWWDGHVDPACAGYGEVETRVQTWYLDMGGSPAAVGKYDIYNAYEWFWDPVYTAIEGTVDPDGTTHVSIDNVAWGTGNLLSRMFYWGNASYADHHLDSREAIGWLGMEPLGWFEDFAFNGSFGANDLDFDLDAVIQYHLRHVALPGADGSLNRIGDIPAWSWGPVLEDYLNDFAPGHLVSELDRYPGALEEHATPGGHRYGQDVPFEYAPVRWDLRVGQTWRFEFPSSNVVFFDPNLTPVPANPSSTDHVRIAAPISLSQTEPASFGQWDPDRRVWEVFGPAATGGPAGHPGPDGIPGTPDDAYALEPWPVAHFVPDAIAAVPPRPVDGPDGSLRLGAVSQGFSALSARRDDP